MQLVKVSFIVALTTSLCSFAYLSNMEDGKEQLYKEFLSQFEQVQLPTVVTFKMNVELYEKKQQNQTHRKERAKVNTKILGTKFGDFIPGINHGMMSRMGPSTYEAEAALATSGKYSAVIYSRSRAFDGGAKSYSLATFDGNGKSIETKYLGYVGENECVEIAITKKMELTIKGMLSKGEGNNYEVDNTKKMFITPKGEILVHGETNVKKEVPLKLKNSKFTSL